MYAVSHSHIANVVAAAMMYVHYVGSTGTALAPPMEAASNDGT